MSIKRLNSEIFNWNKFNEAISKTYDIDTVEKYLHNLGVVNHNDFYRDGNKLKLDVTFLNRDHIGEIISKLENSFGWFLSGIQGDLGDEIENDIDSFKDNLDYLEEIVPDEEYNGILTLFFEPLFDSKLEILPDTLYHITDSIYVDKIKKMGLVPKSKSKLSYHPERIYFVTKIEHAYELLEHPKFILNEPILLTIDISSIKSNLDLHVDVNMPNKGYYTTTGINPKYIIKYEPLDKNISVGNDNIDSVDFDELF